MRTLLNKLWSAMLALFGARKTVSGPMRFSTDTTLTTKVGKVGGDGALFTGAGWLSPSKGAITLRQSEISPNEIFPTKTVTRKVRKGVKSKKRWVASSLSRK